MRVAVVGGGISGLAAAWQAAENGHDVAVYEAGDRWGGKILTTDFLGQPVEEGPDAFLARVPAGVELVRELGLGDDLVSPGTGQAALWVRGALRPLPPGLVLGVPADLGPLARSGILSPAGVGRALLEPVLPGRPLVGDRAVGAVIAERFGPEVADLLVDPLVGGINAGRSAELSIEVAAAQLAAVARAGASLSRGLRAQRRANPPDPARPVFHSVAGGLGRLVDRLVAALAERGVALHLGAAVSDLGDVEAGAAVVATPAPEAARLLAGAAPEAAALLRPIDYASVTLVTLAYRRADVPALAGSGFLVPRPEGRLLTAATYLTNKWPRLQDHDPGTVLIRASAGRYGDDRPDHLDDAALVERLHDELAQATGLTGAPTAWRVSRWPRAFPQFRPGHLQRTEAAARALPAHAVLAGAHMRGVGIPTCITAARQAVNEKIPAGRPAGSRPAGTSTGPDAAAGSASSPEG